MTTGTPIREKAPKPKTFKLRPRRGVFLKARAQPVSDQAFFKEVDLVYRTLCAILFNFVPTSGHPGGSISSGRIVSSLLYEGLDYDFSHPDRADADQLCYAAGHKAMGLYAMYALRNELVRIGDPALLAPVARQLRLEDLLGFRRNPTQGTPLFKQHRAKPLDGHPTPAVPFVPVATGASGVGVCAGVGLALAALDAYGAGAAAPRIHLLEGEGGMTPGRVHEALGMAGTVGLENLRLHVDWNQASIDSNAVCAADQRPGDYVQWDPMELLALHDWNVIDAGDGLDFRRVLAAQRLAAGLANGQPTAIVYRTTKGWQYGIEGRASHGAGHPFCSEGYHQAVAPFERGFKVKLPRFAGDKTPERVEQTYFDTLLCVRRALEKRPELPAWAAEKTADAAARLRAKARAAKADGPRTDALYTDAVSAERTPAELGIMPGRSMTLRAALGDSLGWLNNLTHGSFLACAADLLESTSVAAVGGGFPKGFFNARTNPASRLVPVGGICEDAMGGVMAGVSSFGSHVGVTSSYSAFIAALEHIPARLHAIGQQARRDATGEPFRPWVMVNAHAGPMTGEDGPTHADPQPLQLLAGNFPKGALITLLPWEPQEVWPLLIAALQARPAVIAPFVARPAEVIPDRAALKLPPPLAAAKGLYAWRRSAKTDATVVLQGCAVALLFARHVLPELDRQGVAVNVFYVSSGELFDLLPAQEQQSIYPQRCARQAMAITDYTWPTMARWVHSQEGLQRSLHPFRKGKFLGSGSWDKVLAEAGLDGPAQLQAVLEWCRKSGR
jgi:transketolase